MKPNINNMINFFGHDFVITEDTYIPTPETEILLKELITEIKSIGVETVLDVGTGAGVIALCIAKEFPEISIIATDISHKALDVAKINCVRLEISNVQFIKSNYVEKIKILEPDIIVANMPWGNKYTILDSNQERDLSIQPKIAIFNKTGPAGGYNELLISIRKKKWFNSIVFIESGKLSRMTIDRILHKDERLDYIKFNNYSISKIWRRK